MRITNIMDERKVKINKKIEEIQSKMIEKYEINSSFNIDEYLKFCMNFTEMQMWIFETKLKGKYFNNYDLYEKLFSLKSDDEIISKYNDYINAPKKEVKEDRVLLKKRYIKR